MLKIQFNYLKKSNQIQFNNLFMKSIIMQLHIRFEWFREGESRDGKQSISLL